MLVPAEHVGWICQMGFGGLVTLEWDETFRGTEQKERKQSLNKMSQSWEERFSTDKVIVHVKRE